MTHGSLPAAFELHGQVPAGDGIGATRAAAFEAALAERVGARHAIALASPTIAFQLAFRAAGLAAGGTVLTTSLVDPLVVRTAVACGLRPRFADVDRRGHLTAEQVEFHASLHGDPAAVVTSHFAGHPCDVDAIAAAAPGAVVVEDATDTLGAVHRGGRAVGAPGPAAMTVVGIRPIRASAPPQGALVLTDDATLAVRLRHLREERSEYRLSELHAALGLVQLGRLGAQVALRDAVAARYAAALVMLPLAEALGPREGTRSAWTTYPVRVPAWVRPAILEQLAAWGIGGRRLMVLLHRHPYFGRYAEALPAELGATERFASEVVLLPTASTLEDTEVSQVVGVLADAIGGGADRAALAG